MLWKKLGDLRSEMHARQKRTFIGPLVADLEAFEKVFAELEVIIGPLLFAVLKLTRSQKQNTVTQAANQEYQHARQKATRNNQGGKKLSLELSIHYQKRQLTTARREFDALFDEASALQEKVLMYPTSFIPQSNSFFESR